MIRPWFALLCRVFLLSAAGTGQPAALFAQVEQFATLTLPLPADVNVAAYPSIARLNDDRLLCVFSGQTSGGKPKMLLFGTFSSDHGKTWSQPEIILNSPGGNDYDSSLMVLGPRVIVSATTTPVDGKTIDVSRTMAVRSEDNGATWSEPYEIPMGRRYTSGKTNNGIVLDDGTALLGYTWEKNLELSPTLELTSEGEMEEINAVLISYDQGRTWTSSASVELPARREAKLTEAINGVCEPALVECTDGAVFMLCRTGLERLYGCRSHDGGRTWSAPEPTSLTSHNAPAALCRVEGERPGILAVWNNSPINRWPLSIAFSEDDCKTWHATIDVAEIVGQESSYPCCTQAADGEVIVVYQQATPTGREIRGVRVDPLQLVRSDNASPTSAAAVPPSATKVDEASAPRKVTHFDAMPKPAVLADGTWAMYFIDHEGPGIPATPETQRLYARFSRDRGATWTEPETMVKFPADAGAFGYHVVLADRAGNVHLFVLCDAGTGAVRPRPASSGKSPAEPLASQRLDVWHAKSTGSASSSWTVPARIWEGRAGDLQSVTQLSSGRIVLPVSYYVDRNWGNRGEGPDQFTYTGQFDTTILFSDDAGATWQKSPSILRTATPDLASYGAIEPVVLQLNDGRVWMLLRTQQGRFYESFSADGEIWSTSRPSAIKSSDSPAALARLSDGKMLLVWNNCQRHPYAQGSRHVLHASLSDDDGETWSGYREIVRDPQRNVPPPPSGDHGVSYPFLATTPDGTALMSLWVETGDGRSLWELDPAWLTATAAHSETTKKLDQWSLFGTLGVAATVDPVDEGRTVLKLEAEDDRWPPVAVWNFPQITRGRLRTRVYREPEAPPLRMELTDHFSPPFDDQSQFYSLFDVTCANESPEVPTAPLPAGKWVDFELQWDCQQRNCRVSIDGVEQGMARQRHASDGPSYIRFALEDRPGRDSDAAGKGRVLIDDVTVEATPRDPAVATAGESIIE